MVWWFRQMEERRAMEVSAAAGINNLFRLPVECHQLDLVVGDMGSARFRNWRMTEAWKPLGSGDASRGGGGSQVAAPRLPAMAFIVEGSDNWMG